MSSQFPMACSILVACLATAAQFAPTASLSACAGIDGSAVAVTASVQPAALRLQAVADCGALAPGGATP